MDIQHLKHKSKGDRVYAEDWNRLVSAVNVLLNTTIKGATKQENKFAINPQHRFTSVLGRCKNVSGTTIGAFRPIRIDPTAGIEDGTTRVLHSTNDTEHKTFVITQEAIPNNTIGTVVISGLTYAYCRGTPDDTAGMQANDRRLWFGFAGANVLQTPVAQPWQDCLCYINIGASTVDIDTPDIPKLVIKQDFPFPAFEDYPVLLVLTNRKASFLNDGETSIWLPSAPIYEAGDSPGLSIPINDLAKLPLGTLIYVEGLDTMFSLAKNNHWASVTKFYNP